MDDLPVLVEDVSSDDESVGDQYSYFSTSSTASHDEELKAIYDDHHDTGTRWINQFITTPPWTSEVNIRNAEAISNIDKSQYPSGSTIDMSRPTSLVDLCDFPYLDLSPPTYDKRIFSPRLSRRIFLRAIKPSISSTLFGPSGLPEIVRCSPNCSDWTNERLMLSWLILAPTRAWQTQKCT